jgi:WD40 repeat protein
VDGLMRLNSLTCANVIFPSQELIIPPGDSLNTLITGQSPVLTLDSITGLRAAGTFDNTCLHTLGDMFFSPGGDYLVSGSGLWNIKTGAMVLQVSNPPVTPGGVYDEFLPSPLAVFAPNAAQAAVRTGQTVELWDLLTGKRTAIFSGHSDNVTSLAYSPDGTQLASSANIKDKDILFWNVADGARVRSLSGWSAYDLRFTPNGQLLLANSADTMRFWDLTSGRMVNGMTGIGRYELSPDGNLLAYVACTEQAAYGCKNEVVTLYDIPNSRTFLSLVPTTSQVSSLALSPDGKYVGAASGNGATVWNTADGSEKIRLGDVRITARMDRLYFVPASPGAEISMVATLTIDSQLWFWNIETGDIIHNLFLPNTRLAFTPNARYLLAQYGSTMSVYQVP